MLGPKILLDQVSVKSQVLSKKKDEYKVLESHAGAADKSIDTNVTSVKLCKMVLSKKVVTTNEVKETSRERKVKREQLHFFIETAEANRAKLDLEKETSVKNINGQKRHLKRLENRKIEEQKAMAKKEEEASIFQRSVGDEVSLKKKEAEQLLKAFMEQNEISTELKRSHEMRMKLADEKRKEMDECYKSGNAVLDKLLEECGVEDPKTIRRSKRRSGLSP